VRPTSEDGRYQHSAPFPEPGRGTVDVRVVNGRVVAARTDLYAVPPPVAEELEGRLLQTALGQAELELWDRDGVALFAGLVLDFIGI